jgi:hypothetical protein
MDKPVLKLKPEVAEKYSLAKDYPMIGAHPTFGQIDLSLVNLEAATQLVDAGFEGLVLKPAKASK